MDAVAPPAPPPCVVLTDWERRLLDKARVLRLSQSGAKLVIEFKGQAMLLFVASPAGKVE
jgi:hypothetical protein